MVGIEEQKSPKYNNKLSKLQLKLKSIAKETISRSYLFLS